MKNVNYYLLIVAAIFVLCGCASLEKKLAKKEKDAEIFYRANPEKLAELCNDEFPLTPSEVIPGETKIIEREVEVPGPEIPCPEPTAENPNPTVKCPTCKEIIREFHRVDTLKIPDTRQIFLYQTELKKINEANELMKDKINDLETGRNNWRWAFIVLAIVAGLFVAFKIVK